MPHHEPFQYYASTANPMHLRPSSAGGRPDATRRITSTTSRTSTRPSTAGNFPAVSFLKAPKVQNGHAGNSDPIDEQAFIVHVLNFLQQRPEWEDTAVVIAYDDSDGWYDHAMGPIVNQSATTLDELSAPGQCGDGAAPLGRASMPCTRRAGAATVRACRCWSSRRGRAELHRPHGDGPDVDHPLHRGQLARRRADRPGIVRRDRAFDPATCSTSTRNGSAVPGRPPARQSTGELVKGKQKRLDRFAGLEAEATGVLPPPFPFLRAGVPVTQGLRVTRRLRRR